MTYLMSRLSEPSTWAGLALLADAVGRWFSGDKGAAVSGVCGAAAVIFKEGSGK